MRNVRVVWLLIADLVWSFLGSVQIHSGTTLSGRNKILDAICDFPFLWVEMRFQGRNIYKSRAEPHLSAWLSFPCTSSLRQYAGIPVGISFLSESRFPFRVNKPFCSDPSPACALTCTAVCTRRSDRQLWVCGLLGATCLKGWRTFHHQLLCSLAQNDENTPLFKLQINAAIKHKASITIIAPTKDRVWYFVYFLLLY